VSEIFQQTWWQDNVDSKIETFASWIGDYNAESKVFARKYVSSKGYKSIVDCGCGLCTEYFGYKSDGYTINYVGVDATPKLVELAKSKGIDARQGYIESIPLPDNFTEVSYIRHIVEHLPSFEPALKEAIRIASKEVVVIFFLKPGDSTTINFDPSERLYHNRYSKERVENLLRETTKVKKFSWVEINDDETLLSIEL
jgi:ubiquinone/menaquinone biosynthesis C-methylase UbiE